MLGAVGCAGFVLWPGHTHVIEIFVCIAWLN
jgi:hypothetical protein